MVVLKQRVTSSLRTKTMDKLDWALWQNAERNDWVEIWSQTFLNIGWSHGPVVMGGDSCTEGRGFESQHCILDGQKKQREAVDGPFKKYLLRLFNSVQMSATRWPVFHLSVNFLFPVSFGGFNWLTSALAIHGFSTVLQRNWDLPRLKLGPKTYFEFEHFFSKSSNLFFIFDLFANPRFRRFKGRPDDIFLSKLISAKKQILIWSSSSSWVDLDLAEWTTDRLG